MIIVGVLAGIAIPVFLSQRGKAHDAGVKADVSNLGKEIATYYVGGAGPLNLTAAPGQVTLSDSTSTTFARLTVGGVLATPGAYSGLDQPDGWCVALTDPQGSQKAYKYSALNGLESGVCP